MGLNRGVRRKEIAAEQGIYNVSIVETQGIGDWCYISRHPLTPRLGTADINEHDTIARFRLLGWWLRKLCKHTWAEKPCSGSSGTPGLCWDGRSRPTRQSSRSL